MEDFLEELEFWRVENWVVRYACSVGVGMLWLLSRQAGGLSAGFALSGQEGLENEAPQWIRRGDPKQLVKEDLWETQMRVCELN